MSTVMEPGANDATARKSVLDILKESGAVSNEGDIVDEISTEDAVDEAAIESTEVLEEDDALDIDEEVSTDEVDGDAVEIDSSTLAQLLGVDESDILVGKDGSPLFRAKVDGEEKEISFDSLLRNFRLQQHVDNKATSVNAERNEFQQEVEQTRQKYKEALEQAAMFSNSQEQQLSEQYNNVDWNAFKEKDPQQYMLAREEFRERFHAIQSQRQAIAQKYSEERNTQEAEFQGRKKEFLEKQAELMVTALPEWKDPEIARAQSAELQEYGEKTLGFTQKELGDMVDHRVWVGIRKAMMFDRMSKGADVTTKQVVKIPKIAIRKAPIEKTVRNKVKLAAKKEAATKGSNSDKIGFISELVNT